VFLTEGHALPIAMGGVFCILLLGLQRLGYFRRRDEIARRIRRAMRSRGDVSYAHDLARVLTHELHRNPSAVTYWREVTASLERVGLQLQPPAVDTEEAGQWRKVEVGLMSRGIWTVYHRDEGNPDKNWERLAQCFVPAICAGLRKWNQIPTEFTILWEAPLSERGSPIIQNAA